MGWNALGPHNIPFYAGFGVETPFGLLLPPGSKVAAYVRSGGVSTQDSPEIQSHLVKTTAAALSYARSGRGDTVVYLPGHSESVTDATMLDNLVPGTNLIGLGGGSSMPTFRWTATGSQWTLDQNDVFVSGLRLRLEGANGVVKAILVTGADNVITNCDIEVASGATAKATIALELGAGSTRCAILRNRFRGTATHNVTDGVKVVAAVSDVRIASNEMIFSATAANGLIHVTAAALSMMLRENLIYNTHTASSAGIAIDAVAATGIIADNYLGTLGSSISSGLLIGAGADMRCFQNFLTDTGGASTVAQSGILAPGAVTI